MTADDLAELSDETLAGLLLESFSNDPFIKPLIRCHIIGHREGDSESTAWILRNL